MSLSLTLCLLTKPYRGLTRRTFGRSPEGTRPGSFAIPSPLPWRMTRTPIDPLGGLCTEPPEHLVGLAHDPGQQLGAAGQLADEAGDLAPSQRAQVDPAVDHAGPDHHRRLGPPPPPRPPHLLTLPPPHTLPHD